MIKRENNSIRQSAVRKGDWKYLRSYKHAGGGNFSEKYKEALYNLKDDIAEENNLAETNPEKLKALRDLLEQWESEMSKTAAPYEYSKPAKRKKK